MKGCGFLNPAQKYNVLINGRNMSIVMDFITHSQTFFKCLSTSDCWQDVLGHFELFKPDVYLCFVDSIYSKILTQTNALVGDPLYNDAPVFVVADEDTYSELEQNPRHSISVIIKRPITTDNLILRIMMHLEEREKAAQEAASKNAELEARRLALLKDMQEANKVIPAAKRPQIWESYGDEPKPVAAAPADVPEAKPEPQVTPEPPESQTAPPKDPHRRKHLLVVDDDRTVLKMLKSALEEDYDVTTMVNGLMVEKFLMAKDVDMVILDYEMPGQTGADIFRNIKQNEQTKGIPVCFLTGISDREKIMEVMALKPHSYLLKPIDMDMLKAAITNLTN